MSPYARTHNQIDQILIDIRRYSSMAGISGIKRGNISKTNLISLQQTVRTRKLEIL
jgi:hypothetical protein